MWLCCANNRSSGAQRRTHARARGRERERPCTRAHKKPDTHTKGGETKIINETRGGNYINLGREGEKLRKVHIRGVKMNSPDTHQLNLWIRQGKCEMIVFCSALYVRLSWIKPRKRPNPRIKVTYFLGIQCLLMRKGVVLAERRLVLVFKANRSDVWKGTFR